LVETFQNASKFSIFAASS